MIIFCAVQCTIGISEIYLGCKYREDPLSSDFTAGCRAACILHIIFPRLCRCCLVTDIDQQINRNMQEFKNTCMHSHLSLEMRKNAEKLWSLKKGNPHLRHQSSDSIIVSPNWLPNCIIVLCLASFWLYLLVLVAPGNPALSCPNQIRMCQGMIPHTVRKTLRIWSRLLEFNLICN